MSIRHRLRDATGRMTGNHHRSTATPKQLAANPNRAMSKGDMERALGEKVTVDDDD